MVPSRPSTLTESHRYAGDFMPVAGNIKSHLSTFYVDRLIISTGCFFLSPAAEPVSQSVSFRHPDPLREEEEEEEVEEEEGSAATISKHRPQHGHVSSRFTPRKNDRWWSRRWYPLPFYPIYKHHKTISSSLFRPSFTLDRTTSVRNSFQSSRDLREVQVLKIEDEKEREKPCGADSCHCFHPLEGKGEEEEMRFKKKSTLEPAFLISSLRHSPSANVSVNSSNI